MLTEIYDRTNFAFVLIIGILVTAHKLPRRKYFIPKAIASVLAVFVYAYFAEDFFSGFNVFRNAFFDFFVTFAVCVAGMAICFRGDVWSYLFCATAGYCMQHVSYQLYALCFYWYQNGLHIVVNELLMFAFHFAVYIPVYFFVARKFLRKGVVIAVDKRMQVVIATIVLAVTVFISFYGTINSFSISRLISPSGRTDPAELSNQIFAVILIYSIIAAALALFIEFSLFFMKRTENELSILKRLLQTEREQYLQSKENIELINIKSHDLKHQLSTLKGKLDEAEIAEISQTVGIYDSAIKTGNPAIDVVLTEKSLLCIKNKIRLTCLIDGSLFLQYPEHELYALFGNALDNAIESVKAIDEERRIVSIVAFRADDKIRLQIENYFDGEIIFKDGLPQTKKNKEYHGFGVKSMKMLSEKYGGSFTIASNNDIFTLEAVLPINVADTHN